MRPLVRGSLDLAVKNLRGQPFRSSLLTSLLALLTFSLISGSLLSYGLSNGLRSASSRLGADYMVVPTGYEQKSEGALLSGDPSTFYLDAGTVDQIIKSSDFTKASPQLYIATLDAACCDAPVQLIGFDPKTDFTISPWLTSKLTDQLGQGDIIVGSNINAVSGGELQFFSTNYRVVAKLQQTGMGFDNSVFMNMETAHAAIKDYNRYSPTKLPDRQDLVSVIAVDTAQRYSSAEQMYLNAEYQQDGVQFIASQQLISNLSQSLSAFLSFVTVLLAILLLVSVGTLTIVTLVTLNERKREFAIYRALGSSRSWLTRLILTETAILSIVGATAGIVIFIVLAVSFKTLILQKITLPFVTPGGPTTGAFVIGGFAASLAVSLLAASISSVKASAVADKALRPGGF